MKAIELLAPAKNLESGIAAISYGADAVYIGADRFGARVAAGNSIEDIRSLVKYAHKYKSKVFVTLNTILYDNELEEAEKLIHEIYIAGADALIIQDMGILMMNLPPIALHASTQANNFDPDRIRFFDEIGFKRIILARELSLKEIQNISAKTTTELEFFIHGALCVSLSGQCYFSQVVTGRSANRGMCAQMCRHPYNLVDGKGNKIVLNSHLLSLKDLNLGNNLKELIHSGITSLKIEGRLKDINYVKNIVSYYRKKLDEFFISEPEYSKASSGKTNINFEPDPERSFNRHSTDYFLSGRNKSLVNRYSPKSMGKRLGVVDKLGEDYITVEGNEKLNNGDGLCFIIKDELVGIRVENVIDKKIYVSNISDLDRGLEIYRNYDHEFNKLLDADRSVRKVDATIVVTDANNQLSFRITDEDNLTSEFIIDLLPEKARNADLSEGNLITQLSRSGDSMFDVRSVSVICENAYFFRISELNEIRRNLFLKHENHRISTFAAKDSVMSGDMVKFPENSVTSSENISNLKAVQFYRDHGVEVQGKAIEISSSDKDQLLMTTRYCIKFELGFCERFQGNQNTPEGPLYLEDNNRKYLLSFDCKNCMMQIRLTDNKD